MGPLGGPLLGKSEGHGDSGFIGNDKLRLCKVVPNLYVELRQSVLGVRVPEDIQMKGFRVKIGPNLDMGVPDVVQGATPMPKLGPILTPNPFIWVSSRTPTPSTD